LRDRLLDDFLDAFLDPLDRRRLPPAWDFLDLRDRFLEAFLDPLREAFLEAFLDPFLDPRRLPPIMGTASREALRLPLRDLREPFEALRDDFLDERRLAPPA